MSRRSHDTRAVRLRDKEMLSNDNCKHESPEVNYKRTAKVCNCIFECKKNETKEQAIKRLTKTFKNSIL